MRAAQDIEFAMSVAAETGVIDPGHLVAGEYAGGSDFRGTQLPLGVLAQFDVHHEIRDEIP
jgi:hypothetical protein